MNQPTIPSVGPTPTSGAFDKKGVSARPRRAAKRLGIFAARRPAASDKMTGLPQSPKTFGPIDPGAQGFLQPSRCGIHLHSCKG